MKALLYTKKLNTKWTEFPNPRIVTDTDIIVKIEMFTFSHADFRPYLGHSLQGADPLIMGHEGVGIITEIGSAVNSLKVGDRVAIGCIIHCNDCIKCDKKNYSDCSNGGFILGTSINGTHGEYVRVPYGENSTIKLPDNISSIDGLMMCDVLSTAYENVYRKVDFTTKKTAAIIGDGPISLATALFLIQEKMLVTVFGHHDEKLKIFKDLGVSNIYSTFDKEHQKMKFDLVIESVGNDRGTLETAQQIVDNNGQIITIGVFNKPTLLFINDLWYKNIQINTGILNCAYLPDIIQAIKEKTINPRVLVSKIYNHNQVDEAFQKALSTKNNFKVVVDLTK